MSFFAWKPEYALGVSIIDNQHKRLVELIDQLFSAMKSGQGPQVTAKVLTELVDYTQTHFRQEEELMRKGGYPEFPPHLAKHEGFVKKLNDYKSQHAAGKLALNVELMNWLRDWLKSHILETDPKYVPWVSKVAK